MDCLEDGKPNKQYSENVRQFSLALSYYSPSGYRYLRSVFPNRLPHPRRIRVWLSSVDGLAGVTSDALTTLKNKATEYKEAGKPFLIAMMCDEMYIKKKIEWDDVQRKFSGFVTCQDDGTHRNSRKKKTNKENQNQEDDALPLAQTVFVFMAVGDDFKIPVAYFLLSGLSSMGRAALTQLTIRSVNETGAQVISLTQVIQCTMHYVNDILIIIKL